MARPMALKHAGDRRSADVKALDRDAFGADREALIDALAEARPVRRDPPQRRDRGLCRDPRAFGRGEVIGPVVAGQC